MLSRVPVKDVEQTGNQDPCVLATNLNLDYLYTIITSQRRGRSALPFRLGLTQHHYKNLTLFINHTDSCELSQEEPGEDLRQELMDLRIDEWRDIKILLTAHRNGCCQSEIWLAEIIAAGCLGGEHLWRDLGLNNRQELSRLLLDNFYSLAASNSKDMKWKKYFYKQLCEQEGGYVCRAPSCGECAAYSDCFGPED